MNPQTLKKDRIIHWLEKTAKSIHNEARRNGSDMGRNGRLATLCGRYDDLKDQAVIQDVWYDYCKKRGLAKDHDGFDCAA